MWFAILLLVGLVVLFGLMVVVGSRMSPQHTATLRVRFPHTPREALWAKLVDVAHAPSWRPDLSRVEEVESDEQGPLHWVEIGRNGRIPFAREELVEGEQLVVRIDDENLSFGGSWSYTLAEAGEGSVLTIVERGEVREPVFRFLSRVVFSQHSTMKRYAFGLAEVLGAPVEVEEA